MVGFLGTASSRYFLKSIYDVKYAEMHTDINWKEYNILPKGFWM